MSYFLRAPEPEDLDLMFRLENDPSVWTVSSCHMPYSRYALKQYILTCKNDFFAEKQLRLMVQPGEGGEAVAIVDLFNFSPLDGRAELGMVVDASCRGRGVGQQALTLLCDYAAHTLGLRMLYCQIFSDNSACRRVFAKTGFQEVATLPKWVRAGGELHDLVVVQRFF